MSYGYFARFYDDLTSQVDYGKRAAYFHKLAQRFSDKTGGNLLLDLGCGTGSLSYALQKLGYDVIGVDKSAEMLGVAMEKGSGIQLICQDFVKLDLYGTVDVAVSALDCLNHVLQIRDMEAVFRRLRLFVRPGGLFLFDLNTPYKHKTALANETYVYETADVYCVWQNQTSPKTMTTTILLDFFVEQADGGYQRLQESFRERVWIREQLEPIMNANKFQIEAVLGADRLNKVRDDDERMVFVARRMP